MQLRIDYWTHLHQVDLRVRKVHFLLTTSLKRHSSHSPHYLRVAYHVPNKASLLTRIQHLCGRAWKLSRYQLVSQAIDSPPFFLKVEVVVKARPVVRLRCALHGGRMHADEICETLGLLCTAVGKGIKGSDCFRTRWSCSCILTGSHVLDVSCIS